MPPAPVVAGSRYPPPVAAAIDRLLEIRSGADGDLDSVARIDRALVTLSPSWMMIRQPSRPRSLAAATELVALEDAIYLTDGSGCKVLDPTTGQTATRFELPESLTAIMP